MTATAPAKQLRLDFDPPPAIVIAPPDVIYTTTPEGYVYTTDYNATYEAEMARRTAIGKALYTEAVAIVERWFPQIETFKTQDQRFLRSWRQFLDRGEDCYHRIGEMRMTWLRQLDEERGATND